jgi:adenine/guanine phosphoribosyltransferase-like PRPP-binding protein
MASRLSIPFYEDVCNCRTRQRVNAIFDVNLVPEEQNIICFDDFVTTGQTLQAMERALEPYNKNLLFLSGIDNKL